ncbi:MAG TPA: CapA family protein [Terriglobia bacterium]|nr:CapA family protein [Terriglobia bacterium]
MKTFLFRIRRAIFFGSMGLGLIYIRTRQARAQQPADSGRTVIEVAGDVLPESSWKGEQDAPHLFDGVQEEFGRADLVFVNLEEPITSTHTVTRSKSPAAVRAGKDYILHASNPAIPGIMKDAGIGLVGLANNHMMDYTTAGLSDTLRFFQRAQLPNVGAGLEEDAERAFILKSHGLRIAFLAFTDVVPPGYEATPDRLGVASSKDEDVLVQAIKRARQQANFVVLMIHWGGQGGHLITSRQHQLARVAAESGCDAVVGMHPHVLQGIEYVGEVPVFYSIGNFAFPSSRPAARESVIVRLGFGSQKLESVEIVPVEISSQGAPQIVSGAEGEEVLSHLDGFCRMFDTRIESGALGRGPVRAQLIYDSAPDHQGRGARRGGSRHKKSTGNQAAFVN